jgi:hypothetical protein
LSEIPFPESGIADIDYPHLFPSPPDSTSTSEESGVGGMPAISPTSSSSVLLGRENSTQRSREQSWFYYLSEIALRRIANRVLNSFYRDHVSSWMDMDVPMKMKVAEEFLNMLAQWHGGLPQNLDFEANDLSAIPMEELPYQIRSRMLEIQSWIYRPFLFYAIHHRADHLYQDLTRAFVEQAMKNSGHLIANNAIRHRHHGTWYTSRVSASAALSILAAAQSGNIDLPNDWEDTVQLAVETLLYWEDEAPGDLRQVRKILERMLASTTGGRQRVERVGAFDPAL